MKKIKKTGNIKLTIVFANMLFMMLLAIGCSLTPGAASADNNNNQSANPEILLTEEGEQVSLSETGNNPLIALKSMANNQYVCADNFGEQPLTANRQNIGGWETFELFDLGNSRIALKSLANNKFVCAENWGNDPLKASAEQINAWETFELVDMGNNRIALKSMANNKFVCADDFGSLPLTANRDAIGGWETFEIEYLNSQNNDYWDYEGFTLAVQDDFDYFRSDLWWYSWSTFEGNLVWFNGPHNFSYEDGNMLIQVRKEDSDWGRKYTGGELRSHAKDFFYGRYEVRIKCPPGSGYAASMFTFNADNSDNTWDEIDIEVEGQYKDKFSTNVWCGGDNLDDRHEYVTKPTTNGTHTEEWNLYSFDWLPEEIIFYINGEEVRREDRHTLPYNGHAPANNHPAQVMMNFWITGLGTKFGGFNDGNVYPLTVRYDYFKYYTLD